MFFLNPEPSFAFYLKCYIKKLQYIYQVHYLPRFVIQMLLK